MDNFGHNVDDLIKGLSLKIDRIFLETKPGVDDFFVRECLAGEEVDNSCDTHDGAEEGVVRIVNLKTNIVTRFFRF